ncbi:UNVERIFIED_CONTAM: Aspartyl protease AED3 [Sesamum latifolium]|uniref:Aspartyl protease AED3 n=1 Tax=Sesamum latifolium TaxID=2727402 RepID=A0AAW2Y1M2_9LAMI
MRGLTLPLIHPESPESPMFKSNATHEQRIRGLIYQSHARVAGYLPTSVAQSASPYNVNPDLVRPQVSIQYPYYYMVKVGIGTFTARPPYPSFKSYYLYMDTGSDLLWIQCEGCRAPGGRCFNQKEPVYPNSLSRSYYPLPCKKHKLCVPNQCIGASCSYNVRYLDNTSSSGVLASENFVFNSNVGRMEVLKNLVYGCGVDNRKNYGNNSNQIAGIMGLGWGSYSILSQANSLTEGRFSYCLPAISKYTQKWPNTYLRFGNDAVKRSNSSTTPLLRINDQKVYHVVLQGISINSKKLNVSDRDFRLRGDGSGGCIIDSGTPFSRLIKPAYIVLEKALKRYFWGQRNLKPYKGPKGLELCYERKKAEGFKNLPSMTFHLKNADLVVPPEALFLVMDKISSVKGEYVCLAILPSDFISVIGSYQQTNQRLIYNTKQQQLLFSPENCSKDA